MNQVQVYAQQYKKSNQNSNRARQNLIDYLSKPSIMQIWAPALEMNLNDYRDWQKICKVVLSNASDERLDQMVSAVSEFLDLHED